jgi:hypothetical protein
MTTRPEDRLLGLLGDARMIRPCAATGHLRIPLPGIRDQIRQLRGTAAHQPVARSPHASGPSLRARLTLAIERNRLLAEETPASGGSSPAHSATSAQTSGNLVAINPAEIPAITLRRPVEDTVHDGTPQVKAMAKPEAQDKIRHQRHQQDRRQRERRRHRPCRRALHLSLQRRLLHEPADRIRVGDLIQPLLQHAEPGMIARLCRLPGPGRHGAPPPGRPRPSCRTRPAPLGGSSPSRPPPAPGGGGSRPPRRTHQVRYLDHDNHGALAATSPPHEDAAVARDGEAGVQSHRRLG